MQSFVFIRICHNLVALLVFFLPYCSKSSTLFPVMCVCAPGSPLRVVGLWRWDKWDIIHFEFYRFRHFSYGILAFISWLGSVSWIRVGLFVYIYIFTYIKPVCKDQLVNLYCRDICMNTVNTWDTHNRVTPNHTSLKGLLIACAGVFVQVVGVCRSDGTPAAHLNALG